MNKTILASAFAKRENNFFKCPSCGQKSVGYDRTHVVCGGCDWVGRVADNEITQTMRFMIASCAGYPSGADRVFYLMDSVYDGFEAKARASERITLIRRTEAFCTNTKMVFSMLVGDDQFQAEYHDRPFPRHISCALHNRYDWSVDRETSAWTVLLPDSKRIYRYGDGVFGAVNPGYEKDFEGGTDAKILNIFGSWESVAGRGATFMATGTIDVTDNLNAFMKTDLGAEEGVDYVVSRWSTYNNYPLICIQRIEGWGEKGELTFVEDEACRRVNELLYVSPGTSIVGDSATSQPVQWGAVKVIRGMLEPRYIGTLNTPVRSVTCYVAESLDPAMQFWANANLIGNRTVGDLKAMSIKGDTYEECITRAEEKLRALAVEDGVDLKANPGAMCEKHWDAAADPYVAMHEIRTMPCWRSEAAMRAISGRHNDLKPALIGS